MLGLIFAVAVAAQQPPPAVVTVARGSQSAIEDRREVVVRTAAEWQALWKAHGASDPAPVVDFDTGMVVAVFLGTRPTGGYGVDITAAHGEGQSLVVDYVERRPAADAVVSQALTSPFHIVLVPKHAGPVTFRPVAASSNRR